MTRLLRMSVPVLIDAPKSMAGSTKAVLSGEYDCGLFGERLTIADIGANVGAFSVWATARWPGSTVTAYEPHPDTFEMLRRNVAALGNVATVNAAVYPTADDSISFYARYAGDGEAGVALCSKGTFGKVPNRQRFNVPALHPKKVPAADVVKIDAEGSEAEIVRHLDLSDTSLVLIEFQHDVNRGTIKQLLQPRFDLLLEEEFSWDPLLGDEYRPSLAGDHYGHLFFTAKRGSKLRPPPAETRAQPSWRSIASEIVQKFRGR